MDKEKLDFIGIGDTVTDTFIELQDAWIENDNPRQKKELCMQFGDKLPYLNEVVVKGGGNAPNATHTAMKLGLKTGIITDIGDDEVGEQTLETFKKDGIDTKNVKVHPQTKTNHNYVLRYQEERTILVQHHEYDYQFPKFEKGLEPKWFYLSSLSDNSVPYHHEIADFIKNSPETKLVFQPGTFQIKLGYEKISDLYQVTELFFCNKDEAQKILQIKEDDIKKLLSGIFELGPRKIVITDGPAGAYVYNGKEFWHGVMYPDPKPPIDRTGAGDSFSATFTVAIALGKSIREALMWGPINSMSVVQYIGAKEGHLTQKELLKYLEQKPENYEPRPF